MTEEEKNKIANDLGAGCIQVVTDYFYKVRDALNNEVIKDDDALVCALLPLITVFPELGPVISISPTIKSLVVAGRKYKKFVELWESLPEKNRTVQYLLGREDILNRKDIF